MVHAIKTFGVELSEHDTKAELIDQIESLAEAATAKETVIAGLVASGALDGELQDGATVSPAIRVIPNPDGGYFTLYS